MEKERGVRLWPGEWDDDDSLILCLFAWSLFFLYTLIILLIDKNSFLAVFIGGLLVDFGLAQDQETALITFGTVSSLAVILLYILVAFVNSKTDFAVTFFRFVCFIGIPFYWIFRCLYSVRLHWLFELVVIIASVIFPWKTVSVIFVSMYGVSLVLLLYDSLLARTDIAEKIVYFMRFLFLRLTIPFVLLCIVCFKSFFIA